MLSDGKREAARDLRALGSPLFYALVVVRMLIDPVYPYLWQLLITGALLSILPFVLKRVDFYTARALALVILTGLFYEHLPYTLFTGVLFAVFLFASLTVDIPRPALGWGILAGLMSVGIGYGLAGML